MKKLIGSKNIRGRGDAAFLHYGCPEAWAIGVLAETEAEKVLLPLIEAVARAEQAQEHAEAGRDWSDAGKRAYETATAQRRAAEAALAAAGIDPAEIGRLTDGEQTGGR